MTLIPQQIHDIVEQLYQQLDTPGLHPCLNQPPAVAVLNTMIAELSTTQQRLDVCWYLWEYMQEPQTQVGHPQGDLGLRYTKYIIKDNLRNYAREVLTDCGVEAFDRWQGFWDVEGFIAAIEHGHWKGAAYILEHEMHLGQNYIISEQRYHQLRAVFSDALKHLGGALPKGSLEEQKSMVVQELSNRITNTVLMNAVTESTPHKSTSRKI